MSNNSKGKISLFIATLLWGISFVVLKNSLTDFPVFYILTIRFLIAGLLFLLISIGLRNKYTKAELKHGIILGICIALAYIFQTIGLVYTTPGKNAFLTAIYCVQVPFLSCVILKHRLNRINIIAATLCTIGVGFICIDSGIMNINKGDIITLLGSIFFALLVIFMSRSSQNSNIVNITSIEFITASFVCFIPAILFECYPMNLTVYQYIPLLYLIFIATGLCFFLQLYGLKYTSPSDSAIILTLECVFGAISSFIFYGERPSFIVYIGFIIVFISVLTNEVISKKDEF